MLTRTSLLILLLISGISLAATPIFRKRLNDQFLLGARNQAFVTEYVGGMFSSFAFCCSRTGASAAMNEVQVVMFPVLRTVSERSGS